VSTEKSCAKLRWGLELKAGVRRFLLFGNPLAGQKQQLNRQLTAEETESITSRVCSAE
jgi:hypothetical protein